MEAKKGHEMWEAISEMAGVLLLFIGLYTIPIASVALVIGFLIWIIKH